MARQYQSGGKVPEPSTAFFCADWTRRDEGTSCKERSPENVCHPEFFSGTAAGHGEPGSGPGTRIMLTASQSYRARQAGAGQLFHYRDRHIFDPNNSAPHPHPKNRSCSNHRALVLSLTVLPALLTDPPSIHSLVSSVARPKLLLPPQTSWSPTPWKSRLPSRSSSPWSMPSSITSTGRRISLLPAMSRLKS